MSTVIRSVRRLALENRIGCGGAQPCGLPRGFHDLRIERDRGKLDQPVKLGAVERLGYDQPADKIGGLDRRGSGECQAPPG